MNPINFDDELYSHYVNGYQYWKYCNKRFRPTLYDASYDNVVAENDVWFVKTDYLHEFYSALNPHGPKINIVVSHSDYSITEHDIFARPSCIKNVFGTHNIADVANSIPIPVGLTPPPPSGHGAPLGDDIAKMDTRRERTKLLYVNFRTYTYPPERQPLWDHFVRSKYSWATVEEPQNNDGFDVYLNSLVSHKFCLCPRGNGREGSHRFWESLYSRTIPIIKYDITHRSWIHELPILVVSDWSKITEDFLESKYIEMSNKQYNYRKMDIRYWASLFHSL